MMINAYQHTRVKVCGITSVSDALYACELGADAIGLIMIPTSPRNISYEQAKKIAASIPCYVSIIGVIEDMPLNEAQFLFDDLQLHLLQLHGRESSAYAQALNRPYVKSVLVESKKSLTAAEESYPKARGILVDSKKGDFKEKRTKAFNWRLIADERRLPLILAGGLNVENVGDAIKKVRPHAVDVCSGVEAEKGIKSPDLLKDFMTAVAHSRYNDHGTQK